MTSFPGSPKLPKGAIVAFDGATNRILRTISFQYNPDSIRRGLRAQTPDGERTAKKEALRLEGPAFETINLDIEFDATDGLEAAETDAVKLGVYPQLAALETLIHPTSESVTSAMKNAKSGRLEIIPPEASLTVLVWGQKRVVPVRISDFSITEQAYDVNLNPIRAKVSLGLRVLSYQDLAWGERGAHLFMAHLKDKEQLAKKANVRNPAAVTGVNVESRL